MPKDGFSSVGIQMGAIELTMVGTYVGSQAPLLILYTYVVRTCQVLDNYISDSFNSGIFRAFKFYSGATWK